MLAGATDFYIQLVGVDIDEITLVNNLGFFIKGDDSHTLWPNRPIPICVS